MVNHEPTLDKLESTHTHTLNVVSITVLTRQTGADLVLLTLDIPDGGYPYCELATAQIQVSQGIGPEYAAQYFSGLTARVIAVE